MSCGEMAERISRESGLPVLQLDDGRACWSWRWEDRIFPRRGMTNRGLPTLPPTSQRRSCSLFSTLSTTATTTSEMSKHALSPAPLPTPKRLHILQAERTPHDLQSRTTFDSLLFDELILVIFSYLSYADLCTIQSINRNWSRLSLDNQVHSYDPRVSSDTGH